MFRFATFALFAALAFGQENPFEPKPPAAVDAALKARVQEFFDWQVKGTPRKAEVLVAEDSKDLYYSDPKPRFFNCVLSRVDYTDHFTKAKVLELCERNVMIPGAPTLLAKVPTPSNWRLENGLWMYYLDPATMYPSPFGGPFHPGPTPDGLVGSATPTTTAAPIPSLEDMTRKVFEQIKIDKQNLTLRVGEAADITITNGAVGPMKLLMPANTFGIEMKMSADTAEPGGKVVVHLRAGKTAYSGTLQMEVAQTGQGIPIDVTIDREPVKEPTRKDPVKK